MGVDGPKVPCRFGPPQMLVDLCLLRRLQVSGGIDRKKSPSEAKNISINATSALLRPRLRT